MLKFFNANRPSSIKKLQILLNKRKSLQKNQSANIKKILSDVKKQGDKAVIRYEKKFSKRNFKSNKIKFSKNEIKIISKKINKDLKMSIDVAFDRIKRFHLKQRSTSFK